MLSLEVFQARAQLRGDVHSKDVSANFFLSADELEASRGGINGGSSSRSSTGIADGSSNNEVLPLINGHDVMLSLLKDIRRAMAGDSIQATAYEMNGDMMLDPPNADTKLSTVLVAAATRNVTLRILINENILLHQAIPFCRILNAACGGVTCCAPETRHNSYVGNLHAKSWSFIYAKTEVVAYVGSMDIAGDRWDTVTHNDSEARQSEPTEITNHMHGWHGEMLRLRGTVAHDVARHFWQQWNDPAPLMEPYNHIYQLKPYKWEVPELIHQPGNVVAQLLRTLSCEGAAGGQYSTFAPRGEYSFAMAFKKMVESARHYIYLEDQFVFWEEAVQLVADALHHVEAVIIVTDNATSWRLTPMKGMHISTASDMRAYHQRKSFDLLMSNKTLAAKVHIFELAREGFSLTGNFSKTWLYTHAKDYIVDDTFMLIGSHGIERAAFTNDIDISVGISDGSSGPDSFVGRHRRKVWAEYLRLPEDDPRVVDVTAAIAEFHRQADQGTTNRVRNYYPDLGSNGWAEKAAFEVYEPEGRCKSEAIDGSTLVV